MKIFLTNDDGYYSSGIQTLADLLATAGHEVRAVAPLEEHSGAGHSLSLHKTLRYRAVEFPHGVTAYALNGTPADCVKFGVMELFNGERFDLVISGINNVLNIGTDIVYSGTFNAAMEGTICGIPSIAVSTRSKDDDFLYPAEFIVKNLEHFIVPSLKDSTLNINIPYNKADKNKGVCITTLGEVRYSDAYRVVGEDADGGKEYLLYGNPVWEHPNEDSCDFIKTKEGYITITPILIHAADKKAMRQLSAKDIRP
ncbi:MAG: 5'/3'-nucleotidase SurE [Clostridiaceae bacterium]|jgi:5'-nucleotidase|nr:5'/3'-nucleotidase SurE [Clostridiaceae bacterium]